MKKIPVQYKKKHHSFCASLAFLLISLPHITMLEIHLIHFIKHFHPLTLEKRPREIVDEGSEGCKHMLHQGFRLAQLQVQQMQREHLLHDGLSPVRSQNVTAVCGKVAKHVQDNEAHFCCQVGFLQRFKPALTLMAAH